MSDPGYISRSELCRRLGISRATSYRLERDGFLPRPVRIGPRTTRWPVVELEIFERRLAEDRGAANVHASEAKSTFPGAPSMPDARKGTAARSQRLARSRGRRRGPDALNGSRQW